MKNFKKSLQELLTTELQIPEYVVVPSAPRHLDEGFGIALIQWFMYMMVDRCQPKVLEMPCAHQMDDAEKSLWAERLKEPKYLFLGTGGELDWGLNNLDHHQNAELPSASVLAWEWVNQFLTQYWDELPFNMLAVMNRVRHTAQAISELETQHMSASFTEALAELPAWLKEVRMAAMARGLKGGKSLANQVMKLHITEKYIGSSFHDDVAKEAALPKVE